VTFASSTYQQYPERSERQRALHGLVGLLPPICAGAWCGGGLELGARLSEAFAAGAETFLFRDLTLDLKLQLAAETSLFPGVALVWQDLHGGARFMRAKALVLGKRLFGIATLVAGWGVGEDRLEGAVGGVAVDLPFGLTTLLDWADGSTGLGLRFDSARLAGTWWPAWAPDLGGQFALSEGGDPAFGLHLRLRASESAGRTERQSGSVVVTPSSYPAPSGCTRAAEAIAALGLEEVEVTCSEKAGREWLLVAYENRTYRRGPGDAAAAVRQALAGLHPSKDLVLEERLRGAALFVLRCPADPARPCTARSGLGTELGWAKVCSAGPLAPAAGRTDVTVVPQLETLVGTETEFLSPRVTLGPRAAMPLWNGAEAFLEYEVASTWLQGPGFQPPLHPLLWRTLSLHQLGSPWPGVFLRGGVGKFPRQRLGGTGEVAWVPQGGRWLVLLDGGAFFGYPADCPDILCLGEDGRRATLDRFQHRYRGEVLFYPLWAELELGVAGGRYDHGDQVVEGFFGRFFGPWLLRVLGGRSDGRDRAYFAGAMLSGPLAFTAEPLHPFWVRPGLPGQVEYRLRTRVLAPQNFLLDHTAEYEPPPSSLAEHLHLRRRTPYGASVTAE